MKIPGHKEMSLKNELQKYIPNKIYIPIPKEYTLKKEINNHVLIGDTLGYKETKFELPILSTVSGKIIEIIDKKDSKLIIIENDFKDEQLNPINRTNFDNISFEEFINIIKNCGIIGMSGSGFPTYVKFNTDKKINTLLINAIECEAYLTSDYTLVKYYYKEIFEAIKTILKVDNIDKCIIGVKETNTEIVNILKDNNPYDFIEIKTVKNYYPAGYKKNIMYDTMGLNYDGRSTDKGIIESNIHTIYAVYNALKYNKPVTERIVTFSGEALKEPRNYLIKIGTNAREVIEKIGTNIEDYHLINGGAMMGEHITDDIVPILLTTTSILALDINEEPKTPCLRCGKCASVCPSKLSPVLIKDSLRNKEKLIELEPNRCISCGLCSYVCPAKLNIREQVAKAKLIVRSGK